MEEESKKHQKKREKKVILKNKRRKKMSMEAETATNSSTSSTGRASINTVTLEEAFALTEGNGRATWFFGIFFSLGYSLTGFFSYVLPFLGKYPAFE
jgi:hypothetical protein